MSLARWFRVALLLAFLSMCVMAFFTIEQPSEKGESGLRLGADSQTYYRIADLIRGGDATNIALLSLGGNLIGPLSMIYILKLPFWIMVGNIILFAAAVQACARIQGLSRARLALLLALNATTLVSLATLNKEIFALVSTLLLCRYLYSDQKSKILLALILVIGFLARWEQPAITLLFLFMRRENTFLRRHPLLAIAALVASISIAYPLALRSSSVDLAWATDQAQIGGAIITFNKVQASFGYALVLLPKALMALYNRSLTPRYFVTDYLQQDFHDLANQFVIHLHCFAMLLLSAAAFLKGKLQLRRPLPFFMAVYLVVTAANVFIQPRYQYPVYVLLCCELARKKATTGPLPVRFPARKVIPTFQLIYAGSTALPPRNAQDAAAIN